MTSFNGSPFHLYNLRMADYPFQMNKFCNDRAVTMATPVVYEYRVSQ